MARPGLDVARSKGAGAVRDREFAKALRLHGEGHDAAAKKIYEDLIARDPDDTDCLNNLATIEWRAGNLQRALELILRTTKLDSANPMFLDNLGQVLSDLKLYDKAVEAFRLAIALNPKAPKTLYKLSAALRLLGRWDEAMAAALTAIELAPNAPDGFDILGVILNAQGRLAEAIEVLQHALTIDPNGFSAWTNLGQSLTLAGRTQEAAEAFRRASALRPDNPDVHTNLGIVLLKNGDLAAGWREYEWRWQGRDMRAARRQTLAPQWDGDAAPRTILLHAEQGLGDTLQFCRYAPLVVERGHSVVLEVQGELTTLLAHSIGSGALMVISRTTDYPGVAGWPEIDAHCPLMSLPLVFGTTIETIPGKPYLTAAWEKVEAWRERFSGALGPGLRAGLVWAGNARRGESAILREVDQRRSMSFADLEPLLTIDRVAFVSLQKGEAASQLAAARAVRCFDANEHLTDFSETAAAVANLDLVICVDTSVAHLAGGMGKPVWMLSRFDGCWRWLKDRSDSPWYPTMRIFRQQEDRSWTPVIEEIRRALEGLAAACP